MNKIKRIILITISILLISWCFVIKIFAGIFNIGVKSLLFASVLLLLFGVFYDKYKIIKAKISRKKPGRIAFVLLDVILIVLAITILVESNCMLVASLNRPSGDSTLIVLGSQVRVDGPSQMTCKRLDAAYDYLVAHPSCNCVLSGGKGTTEPWSEAKGMSDYLIKKGIDENRLYLEDQSTSTRENLSFSMNLIEKENLDRRVTIVTNAFHVYRAGRIASREGISYTVLPAKSVYWIFPSYYIRELYAIIADWFIYA